MPPTGSRTRPAVRSSRLKKTPIRLLLPTGIPLMRGVLSLEPTAVLRAKLRYSNVAVRAAVGVQTGWGGGSRWADPAPASAPQIPRPPFSPAAAKADGAAA